MHWLVCGLLLSQPTRGLPDVRAVPFPDSAGSVAKAEPAAPVETSAEPKAVPATLAPPPKKRRRPGEGVRWSSEDGRFAVKLGLRGQVRYALNETPEAAPTQSLSLRRARIKLSGHALGEHNRYKLELGLSPRDIGMTDDGPRFTPVLDWSLEFAQLRDATFRVGQYKLPYSRTRMQSSGDLQFVDRSIADGEFNLNRDVGFDVHSHDLFGVGKLRYYAGVFLGEGRDAYRPTNFEMVYLARFEVLPFGDYALEDHESDIERARRPRLSLGAAYAYVDGATRDRGIVGTRFDDGGTTDFHNATADASFKLRGFTALAEGFIRHGRRQAGPVRPLHGLSPARSGYGWSAQAGYLLGRVPFEFAGRYGEVHPLDRAELVTQRQPTAVLGYYFRGHAVKLQLDYSPTWRDDGSNAPSHTVRLQFQAEL